MPVQKKNKFLEDMEDQLSLVDALWGGTRAMREAGKAYLPKEEGEEEEEYRRRKQRSTLTNVFKKTINTMAGRIFSEPVRIDDFPAFADFAENVDAEGRDINRFTYDFSRFGLRDGLRFLLVDAPQADGIGSATEERQAGIRPYWVEIDTRQVIDWKIDDKNKISQFRFFEVVQEDVDEFSTNDVQQIRVIEPKLVRIYRKADKEKDVWKLHSEYQTSIGFVPVVPLFADRHGFMEATPPLMDLADLNVEHWQKSSDQSNILHVARVPILHYAGYSPQIDEKGNAVDIVVSPNSLVKSADPSAKLTYTEHSGAAIAAGREDLMDIEMRMVALGAEFTKRRTTGNVTAQERTIDESGDISELEAFANNLADTLELACQYTARMQGLEFTGKVFVNTDIGVVTTPVNITELVKLRATRDLSREGLFEVLNDEWGTALDAEVESGRLEQEPDNLDMGI